MQKLSKNARRTALGASVGVVVVGAAVSVAGLASAAPSPTPTPPTSGSSAPAEPGRGGHGHGPRNNDELAEQLATKLGLDQTKVSTALKEVRAVDKPTKPSTKPATRPTPTPGSTPVPRDPAAGDATLATALAPRLGVDEAKVKTALDEIRAARAADRTTALNDRLAAAVTAGTLTQAEADAVKKAADAGVIDVGPR